MPYLILRMNGEHKNNLLKGTEATVTQLIKKQSTYFLDFIVAVGDARGDVIYINPSYVSEFLLLAEEEAEDIIAKQNEKWKKEKLQRSRLDTMLEELMEEE